jgi:hypothetical protein
MSWSWWAFFVLMGQLSGAGFATAFLLARFSRRQAFQPYSEKTWKVERNGKRLTIILGETLWYKAEEGRLEELNVTLPKASSQRILQLYLEMRDRLAERTLRKAVLVQSPFKPAAKVQE